jgi:hypothetical protein
MVAKNDVLWLDIEVDDFELMHESHLLLELFYIVIGELSNGRAPFGCELDAVIVYYQIRSQIILHVGAALKHGADLENDPFLNYNSQQNLELSFVSIGKAFEANLLLIDIGKVDFAVRAFDAV